MKIKRYDINGYQRPDGHLVFFEDHVAAYEKLQKQNEIMRESLQFIIASAIINEQPHAMFEGDGYSHIKQKCLECLAKIKKDEHE